MVAFKGVPAIKNITSAKALILNASTGFVRMNPQKSLGVRPIHEINPISTVQFTIARLLSLIKHGVIAMNIVMCVKIPKLPGIGFNAGRIEMRHDSMMI
jgi:hypothetical protein